MLEVETDVAIVELAGEVGLDLATLLGGIASIANAVAAAVEDANMETPVVIDRAAVMEVVAGVVEAFQQSAADADTATPALAGIADEVDDAARRVAGEGGRRADTEGEWKSGGKGQ